MSGVLSFIIKFAKILLKFVIGLGLLYGFYVGMDFIFKELLSSQARAVLSNFLVFSAIIIFLLTKVVNTSKAINDAQQAVNDEIYNSEKVKVESETRLATIEDSMLNVEAEIDSILSNSEQNAKLVGEKILDEAAKTSIVLKENAEKSISNSRTSLKNELIKRASLASVEVAKRHIQQELNNNQGLHDRLIDESIEAINIINNDINEEIA